MNAARSLTHLNLCSPWVLYFSGISRSAGAKQSEKLANSCQV
eukprot:06712.XXX_29762_29887_1 [CDS] Oithona nana genome sequencing.